LVDDPGEQATVANLLGEVAHHLMKNALNVVDWDGRPTDFGHFDPLAADDYPGFNAAMAMGFFAVASAGSGQPDVDSYFQRCLLHRQGAGSCPERAPGGANNPFPSYLSINGFYVGDHSCQSNYNNQSMHMLSMFDLIMNDRIASERTQFQSNLDQDVVRPPGQPHAVLEQANPWFNFLWAAAKRLGPGSDGPAYDAVNHGICLLRRFPARYDFPTLGTPQDQTQICIDRTGEPAADVPRLPEERCPDSFIWWASPYQVSEHCTANAAHLAMPQAYLLPYWMGRYYGFIAPGS
jgi:hypothetical protein